MKTRRVKRAYRYRFYPTPEQEANLARTFGCMRLVYNKMLDTKHRAWRTEQRNISYGQTSALLTEWKKAEEHAFLNDVSSVPLQQGLRHLNTAYMNFFNQRAGYPRFKSRHDRQSVEYTASGFRFTRGQITLAKHREPLNIIWSRPLPANARPSTVTVSRDKAGRYHLSLLVEETIAALPLAQSSVGLDLGVSTAVVSSDGSRIQLPKVSKRLEAKLRRAQRELARREKGSNNRAKTRQKIARIHAKIADTRKDALHKVTTSLIHENQMIVIEDLAVAQMTASARGTDENPGKKVAQKAGLNRGILNNALPASASCWNTKRAGTGVNWWSLAGSSPRRGCAGCARS